MSVHVPQTYQAEDARNAEISFAVDGKSKFQNLAKGKAYLSAVFLGTAKDRLRFAGNGLYRRHGQVL
jgi:hypothetical protein